MAGSVYVRQVKGYALQQLAPKLEVRQVKGYALQTQQQILPLGVIGSVALYGRINNSVLGSAGVTFSASNSTLSAPSAYSGSGGVNTQVTLTAQKATGYSGSVVLMYRRVSITLAISSQIALPTISSNTTVVAMLPAINQAYQINLVAGDVVDGPVSAGAKNVVITIASTSYMFVPGSTATAGTSS